MSFFDTHLDRLERIAFQAAVNQKVRLAPEEPEQEIARLATEDERRSALFDGIPLHTDGPRVATLIVDSWFARCSACGGNADPNERTHLHGGPLDPVDGMPGLDQERGCGAVFVEINDPTGTFTLNGGEA